MMADVGNVQADDQVTKEALKTSLIDALKTNRKALPFLPEILEELIETKRIEQLNETISEQKKHIDALNVTSKTDRSLAIQNFAKEFKEKNDELICENGKKDEMLAEQAEKISALEKQLSSMEKIAETKQKQTDPKDNMTRCQDEDNNVKTTSAQEQRRHEKEKELMGAVSDKEKEIEELKERLRHAAEEHTSLVCSKDTEIDELKSRNEDLIQNIEAKKKQLGEQTERLERLSQESNAALVNKNKDIEQLKSRIASLSEKRVKQDQSNVEDTLSMNRQSKIEEDFKNFVDEARMDACEAIQSFLRLQEEIDVHIYIPRLACLIFETAFEQMEEAKEAAIKFCKDVSRSMIKSATKMSQHVMYGNEMRQPFKVEFTIGLTGQELLYPRDVLDGVMLALKEAAQTCDLDMFVKDVQDTVLKKWNNWCQVARLKEFRATRYLLNDAKIIVYIKKCLRLTWRMVTQVPALSIEYNSRYLDRNHKKLGYHSHPDMQSTTSPGQAPGEEIACYLWPGLLDGNGRLIRAGEVLCKTQKER